MKTKRMIALLLTLFVIFSVVVSCQSDTTDNNKNDSEENPANIDLATDTGEDIDPRLLISDDLPVMDLEGYTFRIYTHNYAAGGHADYALDYCPEREIGEVINDSVYRRNKTVEDRFNCNVVTIDSGSETDISGHSQKIKNIILSGEDGFDIALEHCMFGPNLSLEGMFLNLNNVKYFNFDKPWWYKATNDEMTVMGQMYVGSNAMFYSAIGQTWALYINKDVLQEYEMEMPYKDVFDGTWTFDKLMAMTKNTYIDVDGNGERDGFDRYGYVALSVESHYFSSFEVPIIKKTDNGVEIAAHEQRTFEVIERLYDWFYETPDCNTPTYGVKIEGLDVYDYVHSAFSNGNALVVTGAIQDAIKHYRFSEMQYGIVPYPKYNENQKDYRSFSTDEFFAIPITSPNPERTGMIVEALAAEGYKQIHPAYYEVALKTKYLHDDESVKALDIIVNSRAIGFYYVYDNWQGFGHMLNDLYGSKPTKDFASYYEKRLGSAQKRVDAINLAFETMK
jgi:hypothetical protein